MITVPCRRATVVLLDRHRRKLESKCKQRQFFFDLEKPSRTIDFMDNIRAWAAMSFTPLCARSKTLDGMRKFKANTAKVTDESTITTHRRKVSLNLPIKVSPVEHPVSSPSLSSFVIETSEEDTAALEREERELEYKHRHTFVGIASLDDFLELLEMFPNHTTMKSRVAKTFTALAANEQLQIRQQSISLEGWELVSRIDPTTLYDDYLTRAHVKLGSICLR